MRNLTEAQITGAYDAATDIVATMALVLAPKLNVSVETLLGYYTSDTCLNTVAAMYARRVVGGVDKVEAAVQVSVWLKGCTVQLFTEMKAKTAA